MTHCKWFLFAIFAGTIAFSIYYIISYFPYLIDVSSFIRLGDKFDNQNSIAMSFAVAGLLFLYLIKKRKMYPLILAYILMLYLCLSTGSISNILCFALSSFIFLEVQSKTRDKIIILIGSAALVGVLIVLLQFPFASYFKTRIDNIINTFFGGGDGRIDYSSAFRFEYALNAFKLFLDKPLFGNGYNAVSQFTFGKGTFSHNNITELLSNFGFFGFAVFELMLLMPFFGKNNIKKSFGLFPVALFILLFQPFLVIFYLKIIGIIIPLFWSLCYRKHGFVDITFDKQMKKICLKNNNPFKSLWGKSASYHEVNI